MSHDTTETPKTEAQPTQVDQTTLKDPNAVEVTPHQMQLVAQWAETHGKGSRPPLYNGGNGQAIWIGRKQRRAMAAQERRANKRFQAAQESQDSGATKIQQSAQNPEPNTSTQVSETKGESATP